MTTPMATPASTLATAIASLPSATDSPAPSGTTTPLGHHFKPPPPLPSVTKGSSDEYLQRGAMASAKAVTNYEFAILLEKDKISQATNTPIEKVVVDNEALVEGYYTACLNRLRKKITWGSFVAEAGDFAATACWEPRSIYDESWANEEKTIKEIKSGRPLFGTFLEEEFKMERKFLEPVVRKYRPKDGRFWLLSLVARDPSVDYVPGAVRAVIVPFMKEFCSETSLKENGREAPAPLWLIAGSQNARDMYAHFGWEEVGYGEVGGCRFWCMIYTKGLEHNSGTADHL